MLGNEMARERIADRMREAESERRSRRSSALQASARRRRVRDGLAAIRAAIVPGSFRRVRRVGEQRQVGTAG